MSLKETIIYLGISIIWAQVLDKIFHKKNPILWKINTNTNININTI
jgi:hypothetical protein